MIGVGGNFHFKLEYLVSTIVFLTHIRGQFSNKAESGNFTFSSFRPFCGFWYGSIPSRTSTTSTRKYPNQTDPSKHLNSLQYPTSQARTPTRLDGFINYEYTQHHTIDQKSKRALSIYGRNLFRSTTKQLITYDGQYFWSVPF